MSWRVVVVSKRCKLEYKLGYLVCRGEELKKVFIEEISTLIVESTAVALTTALLNELIKNKVNIIFCDEKHNPQSQLVSLYGRYDCSGILKKQLQWSDKATTDVWTMIVKLKIEKQMQFLQELNCEQAQLLQGYIQDIQGGDLTNREGHSAKVYFNALFGIGFKRGDSTFVNSALNYGYAVLLSAFNREIVSLGYNT
jgi:CRISPR-associated endonuclease Cas1 subtype II